MTSHTNSKLHTIFQSLMMSVFTSAPRKWAHTNRSNAACSKRNVEMSHALSSNALHYRRDVGHGTVRVLRREHAAIRRIQLVVVRVLSAQVREE